MEKAAETASSIDLSSGAIAGAQKSTRTLASLSDVFADVAAYQAALAAGDKTVYDVYVVRPEAGQGDLAYGTTVLMPGEVGEEYYLTRGHRHVKDEACEIYLGLSGEGCLIVRQEYNEPQVVPIKPGVVAYSLPGAVHRLVNTGKEPFVTFAVWAANSGQDYEAARGRFPQLINADGTPTLRATPDENA